MNTLSYAILGLLNKEQLTGYDLAKIFGNTMADFWNAKPSQIYTELKNLVSLNYLAYEVRIQGESLEKKVYSLTPQGKEQLLSWMLEDDPGLPETKDIFKIRLYCAENLPLDELKKKFFNRRNDAGKLLNRYQNKLKEHSADTIEPKNLGDFLLLQGAVMRLETHLNWIDASLEFLDKNNELILNSKNHHSS